MQVAVETQIIAPPETVFDTLADIQRWPEFISAIEAIELLNADTFAQGLRFRETRIMFGRKASEEMTVVTLERPRLMVFTAESHGTRYRSEHRIAPEGTGTHLTLMFEGRP
ncbi:MAG TPA: SRPBCC family protein, partial [Hyphomicrobiaceae bacterium]|nr:SRPBCC family protein [Hyphomicrobiaceae bacterium]